MNDLKNRSISADLNEEEKALFSKLIESGFKTGNKNLKKMDQENCLKKAQIISDIVCN